MGQVMRTLGTAGFLALGVLGLSLLGFLAALGLAACSSVTGRGTCQRERFSATPPCMLEFWCMLA